MCYLLILLMIESTCAYNSLGLVWNSAQISDAMVSSVGSSKSVLQRKCHVGSMERNDPFKEHNNGFISSKGLFDTDDVSDEEQGKTPNVEETNDGNDDDRIIGIARLCKKNQDFLTANCKARNFLAGNIQSGETRHLRYCDKVRLEKAGNVGKDFDRHKARIVPTVGGGLKQMYRASSHPYIWAVKTIARCNQIDATLLQGLLEKTPEIYNDIGKNARELVSLKLLENLFVKGARANPISSSSCERIRLDPSDRCEDVLVRILSKISQHPESAGLEASKWDLEPFLKHKRSNMPKYALKQASKQAGPSELRSNHSPPSGQKTVDSSSKKSDQSLDKENQDGKRIKRVSKYTKVEPQEQTAALKTPNCRDETTSGKDSETSGSVKLADVRPKKGLLLETELPHEQKCPRSAQYSNAMESSVGSNAAKNFTSVQNPKRQNLQQPGVPKMRQPRIRWTKEEEEMLKEGMRLFYSEHGTYIPWKRILEHGAGVFGKSRTPVDLKDKWKNMCTKG